jgi:hypothetical protein
VREAWISRTRLQVCITQTKNISEADSVAYPFFTYTEIQRTLSQTQCVLHVRNAVDKDWKTC